ncbi:gp202 [Mycobacterium phage Rizal]|uniref:Uncharacterized protein n=1 Tax=Mycobacterium phage Rizal TaxID=546806 RepID=B5LJU0_9CAUD|nr:gp202 [Mycobacterium phage Rizal]ACH62406.1 hypothetical protein RIZAL_202 [Mycobacterium phage Rizal]
MRIALSRQSGGTVTGDRTGIPGTLPCASCTRHPAPSARARRSAVSSRTRRPRSAGWPSHPSSSCGSSGRWPTTT